MGLRFARITTPSRQKDLFLFNFPRISGSKRTRYPPVTYKFMRKRRILSQIFYTICEKLSREKIILTWVQCRHKTKRRKNWGLAVCSNFSLNLVGTGVGTLASPSPVVRKTNALTNLHGYKSRRRFKPRPSPAGKVDFTPAKRIYFAKQNRKRRMRRSPYG